MENINNKYLPQNIKDYLIKREISSYAIYNWGIEYREFYRRKYITIPIYDQDGKTIFFKLRKDPFAKNNKPKYIIYPKGISHIIYGQENLSTSGEKIIICEGEFDRLAIESRNTPAITSTGGSGYFKKEWIENGELAYYKDIYVCFDNDEAGKKGSLKVLSILKDLGYRNIYNIEIPPYMGKDITEFLQNGGILP